MNTTQPNMTWRKIASIIWFPIFFAVALPITFEVAFHQPTPHNVPIAVVGNASEVHLVGDELQRGDVHGIELRRLPSAAAASAAVRSRQIAAAYVPRGPGAVYVARAASVIRANYLQGVFAKIASKTGKAPPPIVDLVPPASGDGGTGLFFFVFPLMMIGLITAIVLLQLPAWGIGLRVLTVATVGALGTLTTYLTVVDLHVLPGKPLLLVYAFLLTQVYGQLMVGAAPFLKQFFLPVSLTWALILSVPSSGGTVPPDLLPGFFHDLSYVMPLAQLVKVTRGVAYFHDTGIAQATVVMALWAALALGAVAIARLRQVAARSASGRSTADTNSRPKVTSGADLIPINAVR